MTTSNALRTVMTKPLKSKIKHLLTLALALEQYVGENGEINMVDNHHTNQIGKNTDNKQKIHDDMIEKITKKIEKIEEAAEDAAEEAMRQNVYTLRKPHMSYSNAYTRGHRAIPHSKKRRARSFSLLKGKPKSKSKQARSV